MKLRNWLVAASLVAGNLHAAIVVRDDAGTTLTLTRPAQRIISLAPDETEMLFAAGGAGHVVGAIRFSDYPAAATLLPVVGDVQGLDLERILSLKPDLIVAWGTGTGAQQIQLLRQTGIPVFVAQPRHLADIPDGIQTLGHLMGTQSQAEPLANALRAKLTELNHRYASLAPVRLFYQVWDQPLFTLNSQNIVSDAIALCGGVNIFSDLKTISPSIDVESVVRANPEAIVGTEEKHPSIGGVMMWKKFPSMLAVQRANLFEVDGNLINRAGPRMIAGTAALCEKMNEARKKRP